MCRVTEKCEVLSILASVARRVVTDDDSAGSQMRADQFQRRSRHRHPDVHQHEVYWPVNQLKRFAQISFLQIDITTQASLLEMRLCSSNLVRLAFGGDHHAVRAATSVVTHGRSKVERRNAKGCSGLDDATGTVRAAQLIAEFCLLAV